jgi:hypothetical protein
MNRAFVLLSASLRRTFHRSVLYSASPSISLSKGEGAVLYIFNLLYNYHIIF